MLKVIAAHPITTAPAKIYSNQDHTHLFLASADHNLMFNIATGEVLNDPDYKVEFLTTTENILVVSIADVFVRFRDIPVGATFVHRGFHYLNSAFSPVHIDSGVTNGFCHRKDTFCQLTEVVVMLTEEAPTPATEATSSTSL